MEQGVVNRRGFLKAVAATAAVATAAGAGAALLNGSKEAAVVSFPAPPVPSVPAAANGAGVTANEMLARLAAVQAENVRLQAALDAANRKLQGMGKASGNEGAVVQDLHVQLDEANSRLGLLAGLVALYEQLDQVDLDTLVENGLAAVGAVVDELADKVPSLDEGLAAGRQALDELESHIPLLENGRLWLADHLGKLQGYYGVVENVLREAVETAGSFLLMLGEWFQDVLKWLPFGLGDKAAGVVAALTDLLGETPNTIHGLDTNVAQPLAVWLAGEGEEIPLRQKVVKPLREQAILRAAEVKDRAQATQVVYRQQLSEPVGTAVGRERVLRDQITAYRQLHQL